MSKVKANLLKVAIKAGKLKLACRFALELNAENGSVHTETAYDDVKHAVTRHQWAGCLSALQQEGFYRPASEGWGRIG